ncbi:capsid protein [Mycobacterium interjectum]|nr:capsid protein [Mycobacterium interjectum]
MTEISALSYSEATARMRQVHDELETIAGATRGQLSPDDDARFQDLTEEFYSLDRHRQLLERRDAMARGGRYQYERGSASDDYDRDPLRDPGSVGDYRNRRFRDPWDLSEMRTWGREPGAVADEYRARALAAIEVMPGCNDKVRSAATDIIEEFDSKNSKLARHALATSSPAYLRAWSKMATNKQNTLSVEEQRALAAVDEYRAMSLTDNQGGFLVPFQLDPTVIVTSSGVRSDIRQAARAVVATGDVWHGVSSQNVSWSFDAEGSEVSDDSPNFAQPSIPNYMARGFIPISIEAMSDEQNVAQEVAKLLAGGKMDLEGSKFITGSGTGEPTGIITALAASSPSVLVNSITSDTFALADIYALQGALPARYRGNASWLANNLIYNKTRQFDTAGGAGLWARLSEDRPRVLLERDVLEAEAMDGAIDVGQDNYVLAFGDFQNFVITDRLGMAIEFIPHLVGANRRPTGQRGWFAYYRTGSDSVNDNAFRLLVV